MKKIFNGVSVLALTISAVCFIVYHSIGVTREEQQSSCTPRIAIAFGIAGQDDARNKQIIRENATRMCTLIFRNEIARLLLGGGGVAESTAVMASALENPDTVGVALIESRGGMTAEDMNAMIAARNVYDKGSERAIFLGALAKLARNLEN